MAFGTCPFILYSQFPYFADTATFMALSTFTVLDFVPLVLSSCLAGCFQCLGCVPVCCEGCFYAVYYAVSKCLSLFFYLICRCGLCRFICHLIVMQCIGICRCIFGCITCAWVKWIIPCFKIICCCLPWCM